MRLRTPFLLLFALVCLLACRNKSEPIVVIPDVERTHLQRASLKGKIEHIETSTFFTSPDSLQREELFHKMCQYYSADGFLESVIVLDEKNDTLSKKEVFYHPNATENYWIERDYTTTKPPLTCTFKYDMNGYKMEEVYEMGDSLLYTIKYKTNGIGAPIEMNRIFKTYSLKNRIQYNELGLVARIDEHDPSGKLYKYFTIEYDNFGDEVNRRVFKRGGDQIEYTYTKYSEHGAVEKIIFEDRLHHVKEERLYTQHDEMLNWTHETTVKNHDTLYIRKRIINYY